MRKRRVPGHEKSQRWLVSSLLLAMTVLPSSGAAQPAVPEGDAALWEPAAVQRGYAPTRFGQMHYRQAAATTGSAQALPPLLCFHQVPNASHVFARFLVEASAERDVYAIDTPGFGMSDAIAGEQRIEDYAAAMVDVMDALGLAQVDLLGYHTGAAIATALASRHPERVRRIVLVAVPLLTAEERKTSAALPPIAFDPDGAHVLEEWQRSVRWAGPGQDFHSIGRSFHAKMRPGARERGPEAILAYDMAPDLRSLAHPVMIMRPRDDLWEATARVRALLPDVPWVDLPDYGHGLFEVAPAMMHELTRDFLGASGP